MQDGDDDPFEVMSLPDSGEPLRLAVLKFTGADRYFQLTAFAQPFRQGRPAQGLRLRPGDIRGHATVPAAFSVAAAPAHGAVAVRAGPR